MAQQRLVLPIVERYREIKRERSVMDFSDQIALTARLADEHPDIDLDAVLGREPAAPAPGGELDAVAEEPAKDDAEVVDDADSKENK